MEQATNEQFSVDDVLKEIRRIKPLNRTVLNLIRSIDEASTTSVGILTDQICSDQAMMVRILRAANSPLYLTNGHVTSIREAVTLLGYRTIRSLAIALTLDGCFQDTACFKAKSLWPERLFVACFSCRIAPLVQLNKDTAYSVGLLYDIGKLVFYTIYPSQFPKVMDFSKKQGLSFALAERDCIGFDYAQVGRLACQHWDLPSTISRAIGNHLSIDQMEASYALLIQAGLALFSLTETMGFDMALKQAVEREPSFRYLGLDQEVAERHLTNLAEEVQQTMVILTV